MTPEPSEPTRRLLEKLGYTSLYPIQVQAIEAGVELGESLVVASPTASGKTLIPLIAIVNRVQEGLKAFYTAPLRSIAMEKYREFMVLEGLCCKVRLSIGDQDSGPRDASVVITTYEKLDSMVRNNPGIMNDVGLLIVDEIHYVGDEERGFPLESLIAKVLYRSNPQIIALSATIPNAEELARWLGARLITSEWRPVPLKEAVFKGYKLHYSDGSTREVERASGYADVDLALDSLRSGGQSIVFTMSRRRAAQLASRAVNSVKRRDGWDRVLARKLARDIMDTEGPHSVREELSTLIEGGVSYHHAGLSNEQRSIIEEAFRAGAIAVLYATPTLAAGVNLPARRVIIEDYYRYSMGYWEPIRVAEYKQLAGRAGRPGLDEEGEAVIIASRGDDVDELLTGYIKASPEPVESKLGGLRGIRHSILGAVASGIANTVDELVRLHEKTLYALQRPPTMVADLINRAVESLALWGLIELKEGALLATPLGLEVSRSYIDPETVQVVRRMLKAISSWREQELLFLISSTPDMVKPPVTRREEDRIMDELLDYSLQLVNALEWLGPEELRSVKTALILWAWINEASDDVLLEKYGVGPGDLAAMVDTATWIARSLSGILGVMGRSDLSEALVLLEKRLKYGVKRELIPLVSLPMIGRAKARKLYNAGYKSVHDLATADPKELLKVEGIGPKTVKAVMDFLGRKDEAVLLEKQAEIESKGLLAFMDE